jgi:hypothetical protein
VRAAAAAQQQDNALLGKLLTVVAQPHAQRCQRQLDTDGQHDGQHPLARRGGHHIEPGVHHQHRRHRGRGRAQVPGPPQREVAGAGQHQHQHDVEADPGDVEAGDHLVRRERVAQVDDPGQQDQRERQEGRARPADDPRVAGQHRVLRVTGPRDQPAGLAGHLPGVSSWIHLATVPSAL